MVSKRERPGHPRAWSSHGEARRNSGNFTRGSQLLGHQWSMWWRGARLPVFVWIGLEIVLLWIKLNMVLGDYEYQMIGQRLLAALWDYLGISEMKRVNITLRDGSNFQTYMGYVPYVQDVQLAWSKLTNALVGCTILSSIGTAVFTWWYVPWARERGQSILADHHERGVELVEYDALEKMLRTHNTGRLRQQAQEMYPKLTAEEVKNLPFAERKKAGLLPPYTLATLPFPYGFEQSHVMLVGTTGTGKTTVLRNLVSQAIARGDRCVIFDLTGHYVEAFYDPKRDHILNLNDSRCESWSVFNDCETQSEFVSAATALIPGDHGSEGGFWERAARTLFVEMCVKLKSLGMTTNKALSDELMKASLKQIHERLKGTVADPLTSPDAAKMAQSIRAVLNTHGEALRFLPEGGRPFSIKEWVKRDDGKASILFITAQYIHLDTSRELLTLWMNIAINNNMTLKHTRILRTWFIFDELAALHRLPALERGMQTARSFGGAFVLGLHSMAGLRMAYGDDGAKNIISFANTKLMLRVTDRETAQECSDLIGYRKVRTMDEAYSYGAHQTRDASTISPTTKEEALVIPDDITSLPNLTGYIRFPEKFPSALVKIPYVSFPSQADGFLQAAPPPLLPPPNDDDDSDDVSGEGGGPEIVVQSERAAELAEEFEDRTEAKERRNLLVANDNADPDVVKNPVANKKEIVAGDGSGSKAWAVLGETDGLRGEQKKIDEMAGNSQSSEQSKLPKGRFKSGDEQEPEVEESSAGKVAKREMETDLGNDEPSNESGLDFGL